ncbi:MAG: RNA-directed DNA polymerase [Spirochaetes bacterium]|nr:RNA-directed DNA polymerase [Spirochaetota bacterium]
MAVNSLFPRLCKEEVMRIGWYLAQADSRDDFVTDPLRHADFASNLSDRLRHLIEQIQNDRYRPRHLLEIDIPKSGLSVRPGNVLPIEEASLLHAIVYLLAPLLDGKLDKAVYSYRLAKDWRRRANRGESMFREVPLEFPFLRGKTIRSISPFEAWYERWPQFEADALHAYTTEGFTHLTKTDITAYFENIDLRLLETRIQSLLKGEEGKTLNLLYRILEGWTRSTSTGTPVGRGIPQGNEVSSFFGNIYLIPLDRALNIFCKKHRAKWFRYVDDVKVFTTSERDAREAVFVVNDALRSLHLNLQGSKTEILSGVDLKRELDNSELEKVGEVFLSVEKGQPRPPRHSTQVTAALKPLGPIVSRFRSKLPDSVKRLDGKANRLFRRLMTVYGFCQRPHLKEAALTALKELPDLRILNKTLSYLTHLDYGTHDATLKSLLDMIEGEQLPFPYQVAVVLQRLGDLHPSEPMRIAARIRRYALTGRRHWVVTQKALEALTTYPYAPSRIKTVAEQFLGHDHPMVRRAACVLLVRSAVTHLRKRLASLIYHPDHALCCLALHFLRFVQDGPSAEKELSRISKGSKSDLSFIHAVPSLYAIAASERPEVAAKLHGYLAGLRRSRSAKVAWHHGQLLSLTRSSTEQTGTTGAAVIAGA